MTKNIVLAAASAAALLGCGNQPVAPAVNNPRNVDVYVMSDGDKCAIVAVPDWLHFPNSGNGSATPIIWHLHTPGYKFVQNNNLPNPAPIQGNPGVISGCRSGGNTMECTNNDTGKGIWKYDIKGVTTDRGCNPPDLDPIISND